MLTYLYNLIIMPLVLIVELIYTIMSRLIGNPGLAIIAMSVVVSTLILPLYRRADALQEEERDKQAQMEHWVSHIKRTFKGDEQYMMLTTYYRQMHYHPLYSLRSSISLLLQIPFFIAAYRFLSGLQALKGISFGPIADLSAPDGMLKIAGLTINLLPILMTVINLLSGAVYSRGLPLKAKAQQYVLTLLFLILLYNRPAGLVLYWTMNNVYSLGKNLLTKISKHPARDTAIAASLLGIVFLVLCLPNIENRKGLVVVAGITAAAQFPLCALIVRRVRTGAGERRSAGTESSEKTPAALRSVFILGGIFLTILAGFLIPISVISDSPAEFLNVNAYVTPLRYVFSTLAIAAGFFLVWGNIFRALSPKKAQRKFSLVYWIGSICALVNYMFFSGRFGDMTTYMVFDETVKYGKKQVLLNLAVLLALVLLLCFIWKKLRSLVPGVLTVGILGMAALCVSDTVKMQRYINGMSGLVPAREAAAAMEEEITPIFRFSRTGRNVVVLMMDRMISGYLPYMLKEKPELEAQFDGFTWYPNTLSYGRKTNFGSPALFGGYEYTPVEMDKRSDELLVDKQNEVLKVMPCLFLDNGYEVTVCDPPYAGYTWVPDLSIYDEYPEIAKYNTMYMDDYTRELNAQFTPQYERLQRRNFFWYSLFRMMPEVLQPAVYDDGDYFIATINTVVEQKFLNSYGVLIHLSDMTQITDEEQDTFLMMSNKTPHEPTNLQLPDYTPSLYVNNAPYFDGDNYEIDGEKCVMRTRRQNAHYDVNMAAMIKLGEWLDWMKENGVYDNTRIIIVADHGKPLAQFDKMLNEYLDVQMVNPMFLVKDFDASGGITTCNDFMTNGDTPVIAMEGLIDDPVNPFTGNPINSDEKTAHEQVVTTSENWRTKENNSTVFEAGDGRWLSVKDDIFDEENWTLIKESEYTADE